MSVWTDIVGVVHLESESTEDGLLSIYGRISHALKGSEGGLSIHFTRTEKKDWSASYESNYVVEPYSRLNTMVITGELRDFNEGKLIEAVEGLKAFLSTLHEHKMVKRATFTLECETSEDYYYVSFLRGRVRTKKIRVR